MRLESQLIAVLMTQDSYFTYYGLRKDFSESFPEIAEEEFKAKFNELESDGSLVAFDLESDGLDGETFDHEEHGSLDMRDMSLTTGTTYYYAIGAPLLIRMHPLRNEIMSAALDSGLSDASRLLSMLPIDSSTWTGISTELTFDTRAKSKLIDLVAKARAELANSGQSNAVVSKATAYLDCALVLAEQPDPDPDIIAELVRRALVIAALLGLVSDLKSLFWK